MKCPETIQSESDVRDFFLYLTVDRHLIFYPDDSFECYLSHSGERFFTAEESRKYDDLMRECFVFCKLNNLCIYEAAYEADSLRP